MAGDVFCLLDSCHGQTPRCTTINNTLPFRKDQNELDLILNYNTKLDHKYSHSLCERCFSEDSSLSPSAFSASFMVVLFIGYFGYVSSAVDAFLVTSLGEGIERYL